MSVPSDAVSGPDLGAWARVGYDDSTWLVGPNGIGHGDDEATVLDDMPGLYTTVYMRRVFDVVGTNRIRGLSLAITYDDGFILYLNGIEVARRFAPGDPGIFLASDAVSTGIGEAGPVEVFEAIDLGFAIDLLVEGRNLLSVQVLHQAPTSSDLSMRPTLVARLGGTGIETLPSAILAGVSVNEVSAPGDGTGWIELFNDCSGRDEVSGFGLSDDAANPLKYVLPNGSIVACGKFLSVAEPELGFTLASESTLMLTDPTGTVLVDGKTYEIKDPALTAGSFPDGDDDFQILSVATQGASNRAPPDRGVQISEIMYHPARGPTGEELEWIELYNTGSRPVTLTDWKVARGFGFEFPDHTTIAARGYLVIASDPAAVEVHYGLAGVLGPFDGGLRNDDETIRIEDHLGNVVDEIHYADDGRWPSEADGGGPSVELTNPAAPGRQNGRAWAASVGDGTPGAVNSRLSASIAPVISRVRHSPPVPGPDQAVTVSARVEAMAAIGRVGLYYKTADRSTFSVVPMADDGVSDDGAAGDSVYGASLPGQVLGAVVEFFIQAADAAANVRL